MHIEFATLPGNGADRINEDWAGACATAAVVLDGVTAPHGMSTGCTHGVPWYVRQLGSHVLSAATRNPTVSLPECLSDAIDSVTKTHTGTCDLSDPGTPSATIAMLRATGGTCEYLVLSDATLILDTSSGLEIVTDQSVADFATAQREALHRAEPGTPGHHQRVQELISEQRRYRNQPGGYWLAASNPDAATHATTGQVPLDALRRAALLSDGAAAIVDTYHVWTWTELLNALDQSGADRTLAAVRDIEASDPHGTRWPRYKSSDDATVIFLRASTPGVPAVPTVPETR
jgi:hypothetical protein